MERMTEQVVKLLQNHDCVTIPRFGGFVLQLFPAEQKGDSFKPMHRSILYNSTLQHTDGLLQESYMQSYGVSYHEAEMMVSEDADRLRAQLERDHTVAFGSIGTFTLGEEHQVVFSPCANELFDSAFYGLPTFEFPTLKVLREPEVAARSAQASKDVVLIPISRRLLGAAGILAAAIALFLLLSTPVKDINPMTYTASVVPTTLMNESSCPVLKYAEDSLSEMSRLSETSQPSAGERTPDEASPESRSDASTAEKPSAAAPQPRQKWYHIVIASFPSESQAQSFLSHVPSNRFPKADVVARAGKYRIYAERFDDRAAAESYLNQLRRDSVYSTAWLFISR